MRAYILRRTAISKPCLILVLLLASSAAAHAYTIVLRSGEKVEIPDRFSTTATTLTYEVAPRINRTILLNSVDISATERANNETSGSLLLRSNQNSVKPNGVENSSAISPRVASPKTQGRRPTLTNNDIEVMRERARANGRAYELQRRELPAESRAAVVERNAAELQFMREVQAQSDEQRAAAESLWRTRAARLREEFAELDAELNYRRARLAEASTSSLTSLATPSTTLIGIPPVASSYNLGGVIFGSPNFGDSSTTITSRHSIFGAQIGGRINLGGRSSDGGRIRGSISLNGGYSRRDVRGARATQHSSSIHNGTTIYNGYPLGYITPFGGYPYQTYGGYDIANMRERIRELEAARGRLIARRRLLEEEARRAGASPGWLRP